MRGGGGIYHSLGVPVRSFKLLTKNTGLPEPVIFYFSGSGQISAPAPVPAPS